MKRRANDNTKLPKWVPRFFKRYHSSSLLPTKEVLGMAISKTSKVITIANIPSESWSSLVCFISKNIPQLEKSKKSFSELPEARRLVLS